MNLAQPTEAGGAAVFVRIVAVVLAVLAGGGAHAQVAPPASVLDRIRAAGEVVCGVDQTPGFSRVDESGRAAGFEVDLCRAVAAAVLGNPDAIRTARVNSRHKFDAVRGGDIDIAFGMTTWTFTRDSQMGVVFPTVAFYDGQGFMVWDDTGVTGIAGVPGLPVCVQQGTTSEANLHDVLRDRPGAVVVPTASSEEKFNAFAERRCLAVTGDRSELAAQRMRRAVRPEAWRVLPGTISREPLGPVIVAGDPRWFAVVRWALLVPVIAEARGVTQANLAARPSADVETARLLGAEPGFGAALGLDDGWARRIVEAVGSYGEIFARHLAPLGLERGENALWRDGGLLYAPPLR